MSKRILAVIATCMLTMLANSAIAQDAPKKKWERGGNSTLDSHRNILAQNRHILSTGIDPNRVTWIENTRGMHCEDFPQYRNQKSCEFWNDPNGTSWVTVNGQITEMGQGQVVAVLKRPAGTAQYQLAGSWHYKMHQIAGTKPGASRKFDIEWIADSGTPNMPAEAPAAIAKNEQAPANDCKKGDIVCLLLNKKLVEATRQAGEEGAMGTTNPIKKK